MAEWKRYNWLIELPQTDFGTLGKAIAELENTEPLLAVTKINIRAVRDDPAISTGDTRRHFDPPKVMKKCPTFLFLLSALSLFAAASPRSLTDAATTTDEPGPQILELKNKSSFEMDENSRNPFWPIGWKPAAKMTATRQRHRRPRNSPQRFPRQLHHRRYQADASPSSTAASCTEGQQFGLQMGNQTYQITVKAIQDGQVILLRRDQEIAVPLRRR